jgi:hypothetical protein
MKEGLIVFGVILVVVSLIAAAFLFIKGIKPKEQTPKGILHVEYQDGEPMLYLALTVPVEEVVSHKQLLFDVNVIQHNSQK